MWSFHLFWNDEISSDQLVYITNLTLDYIFALCKVHKVLILHTRHFSHGYRFTNCSDTMSICIEIKPTHTSQCSAYCCMSHAITICQPAFKQSNNACKLLSPHALQGFTGVVAIDPSLDRNMIHQCTYTRQCTYTTVHTHTITGLQGVAVVMLLWLLIGSHAKVEDLCGYLTHSLVLGSSAPSVK